MVASWHGAIGCARISGKLEIRNIKRRMRFLVFMIPRVYQPKDGKKTDPNFAPDAEMLAKMGKFNEELKKAGALLSLDGLHPLTTGARMAFSGGRASVTDGPMIEAKEVVGGYWMLEAESKQQVVDWMKRRPAQDGDVIEIRQVFEMSDFPADVQAASGSIRETRGVTT